jgi:hypothetical protein
MRSMEELRATAPRSVVGYGVVLVGALGFVVGCFLPYITTGQGPLGSPSLFRMVTIGESGVKIVASILGLFTGAAALAWISIVGMRRFRAWTVVALTSVSVVWSLTWIGTLVGGNSMLNNPNAVGYWLMVVGVGVVIVGTAMVWASFRRAEVAERRQP